MAKILVIEDDVSIHEMLDDIFIKKGYEVIGAYSGTEALSIINSNCVDLVILDLMLPDISGEELISKIDVPIIVLSAKAGEASKVECLLSGANDYMTKPFSKDELLARTEVQLRKSKVSEVVKYGDLVLDRNTRTICLFDNKIFLTKTEFIIMETMISNPKDILTKSSLLNKISAYSEDCDENSLKVHIFNIRKKLKNASNKDYIESVYGIGFKLTDQV